MSRALAVLRLVFISAMLFQTIGLTEKFCYAVDLNHSIRDLPEGFSIHAIHPLKIEDTYGNVPAFRFIQGRLLRPNEKPKIRLNEIFCALYNNGTKVKLFNTRIIFKQFKLSSNLSIDLASLINTLLAPSISTLPSWHLGCYKGEGKENETITIEELAATIGKNFVVQLPNEANFNKNPTTSSQDSFAGNAAFIASNGVVTRSCEWNAKYDAARDVNPNQIEQDLRFGTVWECYRFSNSEKSLKLKPRYQFSLIPTTPLPFASSSGTIYNRVKRKREPSTFNFKSQSLTGYYHDHNFVNSKRPVNMQTTVKLTSEGDLIVKIEDVDYTTPMIGSNGQPCYGQWRIVDFNYCPASASGKAEKSAQSQQNLIWEAAPPAYEASGSKSNAN